MNERNCYCKEGEKYCGQCVCGKDGHIRHAPSAPATAGFCDACFEKEVEKIRKEVNERKESDKIEANRVFMLKVAIALFCFGSLCYLGNKMS